MPSRPDSERVLTRPDDWHLHLRDGSSLKSVLPYTARCFGRALVMPNLLPPVTTLAAATAYRERIRQALPPGSAFEPLMTLYLTDAMDPRDIPMIRASGLVHGIKLYPAGATTHSEAGVTRLEALDPILEAMERADLPLLIHGEIPDPEVDAFDREQAFIDRYLVDIVRRFAGLRIVLEHITTQEAVAFVESARAGVVATLTAHHLLYNRNALLAGGIRPHFFCLPILKRERHRQALLAAAASGNPRFFLGTDSAPHTRKSKESACGCAGCFTAFGAIELYAEAFEEAEALDKLEGFASHFGADFYGLPRHSDKITLLRKNTPIPSDYPLGEQRVVPLRAGGSLRWRLAAC
ncbi:MAG: dihydroorotase [Pseudomonadota bacterium]